MDRVGRGWKVQVFESPRRCYQLKCKNLAFIEMTRQLSELTRREYLCRDCFKARAVEWGLKKLETFEIE
jgi:hypothetical protein